MVSASVIAGRFPTLNRNKTLHKKYALLGPAAQASGLLMGDGFQPGPQALIELAGCLCGGAAAGLLSGRKTGKKRVSARKK